MNKTKYSKKSISLAEHFLSKGYDCVERKNGTLCVVNKFPKMNMYIPETLFHEVLNGERVSLAYIAVSEFFATT